MWRKVLSIGLVFALSLARLSALPPPEPVSPSVTLSAEEYAQIEAAMLHAQEALRQSNETIATQSQLLTQTKSNLEASNLLIEKQSKDLTMLWIFCGVLGSALILEATADFIMAVK